MRGFHKFSGTVVAIVDPVITIYRVYWFCCLPYVPSCLINLCLRASLCGGPAGQLGRCYTLVYKYKGTTRQGDPHGRAFVYFTREW